MKVYQVVIGATVVTSGLIGLLVANPVRIVESGNVGVIYKFGKVSTEVLQPGFNLVTPLITTVIPLDIKTQAAPEEFTALSKDGQQIRVTATTTYNNNPLEAAKTANTIGLDNAKIKSIALQPKLLVTVKGVIAKYSMEQIIANQSGISDEIEKGITNELAKQPTIELTSINVTGIVLDPEVQQSIENKIIASQKKEQAVIDNQTAQIQAETNKTLSNSLSAVLE
jgi:regulator of protease activity HflC (stomatin/prohibitin superfamily)